MRIHRKRVFHLTGRGIESIQGAAGGKPDVVAVIANSVDLGGSGKRPVLVEDLSCRSDHAFSLVNRQRAGE